MTVLRVVRMHSLPTQKPHFPLPLHNSLIRFLDIGTTFKQQLGDVSVSIFRRTVQRRPSVLVRCLDIGASIKQQLDGVPVSPVRRTVQRRPPVLVRCLDIGASIKQ